MPSDRSLAYWQRVKWGEGLVLLGATPFLIFPERFIFLTFIFLLLLALIWIAPLFILRSPLIPSTPYNVALFVFCLTVSIAILVTADPGLTLPKATGLILGFGVWRYLVIAVRQTSHAYWAAAGYLLFGLGLIVTGLLNANWLLKTTSQVPFLGTLLAQRDASLPLATGSAGIHPNQIAGTITLILPLLVAITIQSLSCEGLQKPIFRLALILAAIFSAAALILTQSRSGWAGVLGGLLILLATWGLVMEPSPKRRLVRIGSAVSIALTLLAVVALGPQRIQQILLDPPQRTAVGSLTTLNFRLDIWPWAIRAINDFPFTGVGLGAFREAARRLYPVAVPPDIDFAHAHNVFLQVALDSGIPGLIAYSALLLVSTAAAWQAAKNSKPLRAITAGLLASLAAFHVYGLADTMALGSKPALLIWAIFGLLAAIVNLR